MDVQEIKTSERSPEEAALVAAARQGDRAAFTAIVERYRRELRAFCYRMLGSLDDAEDLVQETLLKAWRNRESFEGRAPVRSWLYRIATNGCLDFLGSARQRVLSRDALPAADGLGAPPHVPWLEPYPDSLLEGLPDAAGAEGPEAAAVSKESVELAFLVAVQFLPAKQRAALILCDALDWSAREASALLGMSVASVNSALQRARATLKAAQPMRAGGRKADPATIAEQRRLVDRYVLAHERRDVEALSALLHEGLRFSMPPHPETYVGRERIVGAWVSGGFGTPEFGEFRCIVTRSNGMPAIAVYRKRPGGDRYRPLALDVLEIEDGLVREVTAFCLEDARGWFGLPEELP